jgi:hypothetical protein
MKRIVIRGLFSMPAWVVTDVELHDRRTIITRSRPLNDTRWWRKSE